MYPEDYTHSIFATRNTSELKQHLQQLNEEFDADTNNQACRILRDLRNLARNRRGLRLDTKYGIASYSYNGGNPELAAVRFDGEHSCTIINFNKVNKFWFDFD